VKRILVTGAAGYIGSAVCHKLLEHGYQVVGIDNLKYSDRDAVPVGADFFHRDICDSGLERSGAFFRIDAVMHLAAESEIPVCTSDPLLAFRVNLAGGINLLSAMQKNGCNRLIFSSTAAVYSPDARSPIIEGAAKEPTTPYGASKLAFERALGWFPNLSAIIFRYFNVCGATEQAWERPIHRTRLVSIAMDTACKIRPEMPLNGTDFDTPDGTCVRDYLHVDDVAEAHVLALQNETMTGAFNLGIGKGYSNREVIQTVERVTKRPVPVVESSRRLGDPDTLIADSSLARAFLNWKPKFTDLEAMIESAWRYENL